MPTPRVPLNELAAAVESAVQQTLAKHGAVSIDKLWIGFVAPDAIANEQAAQELTTVLAREGGGRAQPSVAQLGGAAGGAEKALATPHRIIGLIYEPKVQKQ
jgi:hypothetical protein